MEREPRNRKNSRDGRANRTILIRTVFLMCLCGIVLFVPLLARLWQISIVDHERYKTAAIDQQTRDVEVSASRGKIYDATGNTLALSATVYNLILSPRDVVSGTSLSKSDFASTEEYQAVINDPDRKEAALNAKVEERRKVIVDGLVELLDLDREQLEKRMLKTNSAYEILKKNIEEEDAEKLREFISENKLGLGLYLTPGTKRYYPYGNLASQVIGFVNDNGGAYGLEAIYDDELSGQAGRVVTAKNAKGTEMESSYSNYVDAVDGSSLHLTIDSTIQSYAEQVVREGIEQYDVQNGGICIVMNPKTGAIYALVSIPDYDLNDPSAIYDGSLKAGLEKMKGDSTTTDEAYQDAVTAARAAQWRSKALNDAYEPGSTFKSVVLSAALEEGVVSESDTFYCPGYAIVNGQRINCSKHAGHGMQTLAEAVANSCNPAFITIGQRLGAEKFYQYFTDFGMKNYTGIDLQGEALGTVWDEDYFTSAEGFLSLATASFGQRFTVTPIQMITAFSATINGGNLVQPYVVDSVTDSSGNVVSKTETTVARQVISEETSKKVRTILEGVVANGSGRNAYVAGYRIGGKTGTSETKVKDEFVVSFMGFAPANDPEIIVLLAYDTPKVKSPGSNYCTTGTYISGGQMAAPKVGSLIAQILDYMGVEKVYSSGETAQADVTMPRLAGKSLSEAEAALNKVGLKFRKVGGGTSVTGQIPAAGSTIPGGSEVVLYLGEAAPTDLVTVPNVAGKSLESAKAELEAAGLYLRANGISGTSDGRSVATSQSVEAGAQVERGTVVEVSFVDTSISD